ELRHPDKETLAPRWSESPAKFAADLSPVTTNSLSPLPLSSSMILPIFAYQLGFDVSSW
ncbi:hypothetical protein HAX54_017099, partial [Datura stramonium]|nr:hypothetical protein [Datura stramonium]